MYAIQRACHTSSISRRCQGNGGVSSKLDVLTVDDELRRFWLRSGDGIGLCHVFTDNVPTNCITRQAYGSRVYATGYQFVIMCRSKLF